MKVKVIAHPGSFKPRIEEKEDGLHVYVHDQPEDDRANKAIVLALAQHFEVPPFEVELKTGHTSKVKFFEIHDVD
jgi:uncharacterized protein YggU (UPF0235/DUF167 family)